MERYLAGELDEANQISAPPSHVAVEDIFARVDIKRRPDLLVQRTESHILEAARSPASPVLLP